MKTSLILTIIITVFFVPIIYSQETSNTGYQLETIKENKTLLVENQYMSSTCWSFSGLAMIESELIKNNKQVDLSEMYIVRCVYIEKAKRFIRMHGKIGFSGGGALNDVTDIIKIHGIVPYKEYTGLKKDAKNHIHYEMDSVLLHFVKNMVKKDTLPTDWLDNYVLLLDDFLGEAPKTFQYEGKKFTPKSFAQYLGINPGDYLLFTSYTHHPFYEKFIVEVPDNWSWGQAYNLPLNELIETIDSSLFNGNTVAWASDVSERSFSWSKGIAIIPEKEDSNMFNNPVKEMIITQELRQEGFDRYFTTDDHGMLITGIAKSTNGQYFYRVKNSWGTDNEKDGYIYASRPFVKYKTMTILVNKNGIPSRILNKIKVQN